MAEYYYGNYSKADSSRKHQPCWIDLWWLCTVILITTVICCINRGLLEVSESSRYLIAVSILRFPVASSSECILPVDLCTHIVYTHMWPDTQIHSGSKIHPPKHTELRGTWTEPMAWLQFDQNYKPLWKTLYLHVCMTVIQNPPSSLDLQPLMFMVLLHLLVFRLCMLASPAWDLPACTYMDSTCSKCTHTDGREGI